MRAAGGASDSRAPGSRAPGPTPPAGDPPWRRDARGLLVDCSLTPRAAEDRIDGIGRLSDGRPVLLARVRAVPDKGAANAALTRLFAKSLRIGKSAVALHSGQTARLKVLRLQGDGADLEARLSALAGPVPAPVPAPVPTPVTAPRPQSC